MADLRAVHFAEPEAFLDALKAYDDSFMNFALGSLLDSMNPAYPHSHDRSTISRTLLAVYKGDQLLITLSKISDDFSWIIATPRGAEDDLTPENVSAAMSQLASLLFSIIDPKRFDKAIGPTYLVNTFLQAWVTHTETQGYQLKTTAPLFSSRVSFATLATIPPPSSTFSHYKVSKAQTEADAEAIVPLIVDFRTHGLLKFTVEEAQRQARVAVNMKQLWFCRVGDEIAAYILIGRITPRTVAIRNVYVAPAHRRKGIAEAMVRALTRYYLGAEPLGFEGAPSPKPDVGTREEICLNVAEEFVARLYARCGFLLGPDDHDPVTGKKGCFDSCWRGVEPL
ncbi:hypothetical protein EIP86_010791 [Pleurotus ostreatoroseus]|nr:hypothetical protein EIP86_010791 [Pleurotus ostreatoroseus]